MLSNADQVQLSHFTVKEKIGCFVQECKHKLDRGRGRIRTDLIFFHCIDEMTGVFNFRVSLSLYGKRKRNR